MIPTRYTECIIAKMNPFRIGIAREVVYCDETEPDCLTYLPRKGIQPRTDETIEFTAQRLGDGAASKIYSGLDPTTTETSNRILEKSHN